MPDRKFSSPEIADVTARYPQLRLVSPSILEGTLDMEAEFEGERITGSFHVRITAANPNSDLLPALYEIGGRTEAIGRKYGIKDFRDLHRNGDGTACVCVKPVEGRSFPPGSSLLFFIEQLAVPYLYGLTYRERHGRWPWKEFSHGSLGLLEFYADDQTTQTVESIAELVAGVGREPNWKDFHKQFRRPSANRACLCGSRKPFGKCHAQALSGVLKLHLDLKHFNLNLDHLRQISKYGKS